MSRISTIRRTWELALLCTAGLAVAPAAADTPKVGQAEVIRNEVVNATQAQSVPINVGDNVMRDDVIRTSADANARFGLIDNTKLTLGPASTLKIDRAVLADQSRYKQITIRLTEGAFRFITGNSDKKSYRIETPSASIGVRGTILDIRISEKETLVSLQNGRANVCAGGKCTQLLERGHTANITREGGIIQIKRDLVPTWTFASVCSTNSTLCSPLPALRKASLTAPVRDKLGKKGAITRFCPDGQPMKGVSCGPGLDPLRETSLPTTPSRDLPLLNNPTRDTALPGSPSLSPTTPSISAPDLGRANLPSVSPRLSVPTLRR
ncbi:FecR domain-containing protein [Bradyrhizobium sp.]|uniref:FecR family protein n=1 Tax=Bradyrhizobium sp. TaxID=376 RepID=UPI001DFA703C|nr:FecR domain-containing protein [Bradyrhizobium sp.]MBI5322345.1 FecR domain-containing protein [Bradyrhizobium sp.]